MTEDDSVFSKEYRKGTETTANSEKPTREVVSIAPEVEETEAGETGDKKYGIGKPRRDIVRARIIHD